MRLTDEKERKLYHRSEHFQIELMCVFGFKLQRIEVYSPRAETPQIKSKSETQTQHSELDFHLENDTLTN